LQANTLVLHKLLYVLLSENHHNNNDPDQYQKSDSVSTLVVDEFENKNKGFS
jgi:hypothetical protein